MTSLTGMLHELVPYVTDNVPYVTIMVCIMYKHAIAGTKVFGVPDEVRAMLSGGMHIFHRDSELRIRMSDICTV